MRSSAKWLPKYKRWQINVTRRGERKSFYSSTRGRQGKIEAEEKALKWLSSGISQSPTVDRAFREFLQVRQHSLKESTLVIYERTYRVHIKACIGSMKVSEVRLKDYQSIIDKAFRKGLSKSTLKTIKQIISSFNRYCLINEYTEVSARPVLIPRFSPEPKEKHILSARDIQVLLTDDTTSKGKKDSYIYYYRFLLVTGIRVSELLALRKSDVTEEGLLINKALSSTTGKITTGKSKNSERVIPLSDMALQILEKQKELLKNQKIICPLLFPYQKTEKYLSSDTLRKKFRNYSEYHSLEVDTLHELRHTFISLNRYMDSDILKQMIGHSKAFNTLGTYGHLTDRDRQIYSDTVDSNFKSVLQSVL